jgi:hypothetical protein
VTRYNQKYYEFNKNVDQKLHGSFKVPSTYAAGSAISIKGKIHTDTAGGDLLLTIKSTLIRQGVDLISSVTNQRISTNTAESVPALDQDIIVDWDIVSSIGEVNSVALSANDRIDLEVYRGSDSNTGNLYFSTSSLEVVL